MKKILAALTFLLIIGPAFALNLDGTARIDSQGFSYINIPGYPSQSSNYTTKIGDNWYFDLNEMQEYQNVNIAVYVPQNAVLKSVETNLAYTIGYDSAIVLQFSGKNVTPRIEVRYVIETTPAHDYSFIILLGAVIIILCAAIAVTYFKTRKEKDKVLSVLNERERQVIITLRELKGKAKQSKLRRVTGLPKSTLSRTIKNLEKKGLIVRDGEGSLAKIMLK